MNEVKTDSVVEWLVIFFFYRHKVQGDYALLFGF